MKPEDAQRDRKALEIFSRAVAITGAESLAAYLEGACGGDEALKARVEVLLANHLHDSFLQQPAAALAVRATAGITPVTEKSSLPRQSEAMAGDHIGRYKLLEKLGEGGFGAVWAAEQKEPMRRRVALKIVKLGMDTQQIVARFEAERQALALMDHPNIAKVLDAGATENGRPYFVMELVRGIRVTEYCDQNKLSANDRLNLFIRICHAVQHAHQKGIIHRDIKPSNILVTLHDGVPVPKVIDFGIAKATQADLTDKTIYTQFQQFIGTPAYMSPEQAEMSGLDLDTRSDIYSLGVLLYELLAGRTPFDGAQLLASGVEEMRRILREVEPARPSTRLSTMAVSDATAIARARHSQVPSLVNRIRGDLDWIVMKCLEKDRTRRYATANGLATDLQRHLKNEPVVARPPSTVYKLQKSWRRNKLVFGAAAAIVLALAVGLGLAAAGWQQARKQRDEAFRARASAQANEQKAQQAEASQTELRLQAEAHELAARRRAYASDINLAHQAIAANNFGRAETLLHQLRPEPGQLDLRGWEWRYLWQFCRSDEIATLCQRSAGIDALTLSPDGRWLMLATRYGDRSVWDLHEKVEVAQLPGGARTPRAVFSPKGSLLAFGIFEEGSGVSVCLWDAASRTEMRKILLPGDGLAGLVFSADGARLLTWTANGDWFRATNALLTIFRVADGAEVARHPVYGGLQFVEASSLAVTHDLGVAYFGTLAGSLHAFDLTSGRERWRVQATEEAVLAVALSPDGKRLATGGGFTDATIRLWNAASGSTEGSLDGHFSFVSHLLFMPDSKTLVSASGDQTIRRWHVDERQPAGVLRGHHSEIWRLALSADAKTLFSGCKDGTVKLWSMNAPERRQGYWVVTALAHSWCFAPDGRGVYLVERAGDSFHGRVLWTAAPDFRETIALPALGSENKLISISSDGHWLAAVQASGTLTIFDRASGRVVTNLVGLAPFRFASFHADSRRLVAEDYSGNWCEWETGVWTPPRRLKHRLEGRSRHALSADGRFVLTMMPGSEVVVANLLTGIERREKLPHREVIGLAISPDLRSFATSSGEGNVKLWDLATFREIGVFQSFLQGVHSVAFSPDGSRLAAGSNGREAIQLLDLEGHRELLTLPGLGSQLEVTAFSLDGSFLGTSSTRGQLNLWRAPSWKEIDAAEANEKTGIRDGNRGHETP